MNSKLTSTVNSLIYPHRFLVFSSLYLPQNQGEKAAKNKNIKMSKKKIYKRGIHQCKCCFITFEYMLLTKYQSMLILGIKLANKGNTT